MRKNSLTNNFFCNYIDKCTYKYLCICFKVKSRNYLSWLIKVRIQATAQNKLK